MSGIDSGYRELYKLLIKLIKCYTITDRWYYGDRRLVTT